MIWRLNELSQNNQLRIFQVIMFLKTINGGNDPETETDVEIRDMLKTKREWRFFRKDLFRQVNRIRKKFGLPLLGA